MMETKTLLDFSAFVCFINKELVWWHKMIFVEKNMLIAMEVIDGWSFFPKPMTHETKALDIIMKHIQARCHRC